uniref:Ribosomal protein S11 n=1 Tax=Reclinomonas americana ATCC 50633 TaxID=1295593 RepID=M4QAD7_RECAM|nr:ribosomal protein S11 [Reclinomonas americana ATCC 50633]
MIKELKKDNKKDINNLFYGHVHVKASFTNTIVTITDIMGNTISWASSGSSGFKGARRSTSYAAQAAAENAGKKAVEHGIRSVKLITRGLGPGRLSCTKGLLSAGLKISLVGDLTPIPHNGCRAKKKRRV